MSQSDRDVVLRNRSKASLRILQTFYNLGITSFGLVRSIAVGDRGGTLGPISGSNHTAPYRDEHLFVDFEHQSAALDTLLMSLTRKEYDLLALLVKHAGEIIPREALLMQVWGYGAEIAARIAEELFDELDAPVKRVAAMDTFCAYQPKLEDAILPQTEDITSAVKKLLEY